MKLSKFVLIGALLLLLTYLCAQYLGSPLLAYPISGLVSLFIALKAPDFRTLLGQLGGVFVGISISIPVFLIFLSVSKNNFLNAAFYAQSLKLGSLMGALLLVLMVPMALMTYGGKRAWARLTKRASQDP